MTGVRNRTAATPLYATPALERLAYLLCGFALCWALLSLLGWWYLSDRREHYDGWRIGVSR